ncbi:MAG TPA: tetratricopeptide repeat protein [Candidatus Nitrosotalea sp.]|nr:tetratricopeptide repeat protein [Candidatus Nitrosotalea sp.]
MPENESGGLPPRIYVPIVTIIGAIFLVIMGYLVANGFGVTGSVFGKAANSQATAPPAQQGSQNAVEGGPPAPVMAQLEALRARIAAHPNDDVALTQLGDMYLAANKFAQAIPLYRRALRANPNNVAAQTGLAQAQDALRQ